jgi:hypothetical protein
MSTNPPQAVREYLAKLGRKGGKVSSPAKAKAARKNAKLGGWPKGRPRKVKVRASSLREPWS